MGNVASKVAKLQASAAKKAAGKKEAPAKKAAAPKKESEGRKHWYDAALAEKVVVLRDKKDTAWSDIAADLKITAGKAMALYEGATCSTKDRLKGTDAEVGKAIVALRHKEQLSEIQLMGRTLFPLSKIHRLYEEHSGKSWSSSRIGRGGRSSEGTKPVAKKKAAAKEPKAKKGKLDLTNMSLDDLKAALNHKTITANIGGKARKIQVKTVQKVGKTKSGGRAVAFTDVDAKSHTVNLDVIAAVR